MTTQGTIEGIFSLFVQPPPGGFMGAVIAVTSLVMHCYTTTTTSG